MVNRNLKRIVFLEFKRTTDTSETYYHDMRKVAGKQQTPILTGLKTLVGDRGLGGGSSPVGCGSEVGKRKGVAGDSSNLRDWV